MTPAEEAVLALAEASATPGGPPGLTEEAIRRRGEIIMASARLFDANGYARTSMEDISAAVGLAKPTLYHYFRSKAEILVEIHETFISLLIEQQEARIRSGTRPDDQLLAVMKDILALMESHRGHVRVFFEHHRELPPDARQESRRKRNYYEHLVTQVIADGVRQGIFAVEDPHLTALAVFGICNWAYQWWKPNHEGRTTGETAEILFRTLANGLMSPSAG
jgi:AcrR family transcriptional regulator